MAQMTHNVEHSSSHMCYHRVVLVAMMLGLLLQGALGAGAFLRAQVELLREARFAGVGQRRAQDDADPLVAVEKYVTGREPVLYVTPDVGTEHTWTYFQLSYHLYPSQVWWVAPTARTSPINSWISCSLTGPDLESLAQSKGSRLAIVDGLDPPESRFSQLAEIAPQFVVLQLR